jgi:hypothetical protein
MVRRRRTDGRVAFENLVDPFQPEIIVITILHKDQIPLTGTQFSISHDKAKAKSFKTSNDGTIRVTKPKNEITLILTDERLT